jgi:hypothetical protein
MKTVKITLIAAVIFAQGLFAQFSVDAETGMLSTSYNDVKIDGVTGEMFSLSEDLEDDPSFFYRLRLNFTLKDKHFFSLLYAPLLIESSGNLDEDIYFMETSYPAGTDVEASYTFNSYRLTYRYEWINREHFEFGIGFTAKIRDAEIKLASDHITRSKKNVGFVPIVNFRLFYKYNEIFGLLVEGDALAAPQGRAEDVLAALTWKAVDGLTLKAGYRILEGGADNDEVYTFSLINYAVLGFIYSF